MPLNPEHRLSPATVRALNAAFQGSEAEEHPIDDVELAAFACGMSVQPRHSQIVSHLTRSHRDRVRLVALQRQMASEGLGSPLLNPLLSRAIESYSGARNWLHSRDWSAVRSGFGPEAASARAVIAAICRDIRLAHRTPRYGWVRGAEDEVFPEGLVPVGVEIHLFAELREDGTLSVEAVFEELAVLAAAPLTGREFVFELLASNGDSIPLGRAPATQSGCTLEIPGFGGVSGFPVGTLPSSSFRLTIEGATRMPRARNHLFVEVDGFDPIPLEIVEEPRISDAHLVVSLRISEVVRQAHPGKSLELSMPVGLIRTRIGTWPLAEWREDVRTLRIPLPGISNAKIEFGSILQGRLIADREGA